MQDSFALDVRAKLQDGCCHQLTPRGPLPVRNVQFSDHLIETLRDSVRKQKRPIARWSATDELLKRYLVRAGATHGDTVAEYWDFTGILDRVSA
jgi:hypothetical protein